MLSLNIFGNVRIHLIPGHSYGLGRDDIAQGKDGDVTSSPTHIDNHIPTWLKDIESCTNSGYLRLVFEINLPATGLFCRLNDGLTFNLRNVGRGTDHNIWLGHEALDTQFSNKVGKHFLGNIKVRNHPVL